MPEVKCPRCGDSFDSRGLTSHLINQHDVSSEMARSVLEVVRGDDSPDDGGDDRGDRERSTPFVSEADHVQDEPSVRDLDVSVAQARRLAELRRLSSSFGDEKSDLQRLAELKDAGLLGGGADSDEIRAELAQLRAAMAANSGSGNDGAVSSDGGGRSSVAELAAQGVTDPDILSAVAATEPEVAAQRLALEKVQLKYEARREMAEAVVDGLQELGPNLGRVLAGALEQRQEARRERPSADQVREMIQSEGQQVAAENAGDGDRAASDAGQAPKPRAEQRFDELKAEHEHGEPAPVDEDGGRAEVREGFRSPGEEPDAGQAPTSPGLERLEQAKARQAQLDAEEAAEEDPEG